MQHLPASFPQETPDHTLRASESRDFTLSPGLPPIPGRWDTNPRQQPRGWSAKSFPESGRAKDYVRDVCLLANVEMCIHSSVCLVQISWWLQGAGQRGVEGRGVRLVVCGEGCPHTPSATVGSVRRHLAASLAWAATVAAAHCHSAPLLTASTAVGSSRCSCPEASPGRQDCVFCQHQW